MNLYTCRPIICPKVWTPLSVHKIQIDKANSYIYIYIYIYIPRLLVLRNIHNSKVNETATIAVTVKS